MTVRSADVLVVASGEVPLLRRSGDTSRLSMPALSHDLVVAFVGEIAGEKDREELGDAGSLDTVYEAEDGAAFSVKLESKGQGLRITFRPRDPAKPPGNGADNGSGAASGAAASPRGEPMPPLPPAQPHDRRPGRKRSAGPTGYSDDSMPVAAAPTAEPQPIPGARETELAGPVLGQTGPPGAIPDILMPLLDRATYERASDIILSAGQSPRMRMAGQLVVVGDAEVTDADLWQLVRAVASERGVRELAQRGSVDLALEARPGLRFRVNVFRQAHGLAAALRPIRRDLPTLIELELPDHLYDLVSYPHGLVLVCGPTGSGKSTTLVALIEHLNRTQARHIVTIEDPIEYHYTSRRSLVHQRELGSHVDSFATGLRAALREDPDVILVGEMRDRETIAAALTAAETGHLVLSTLHSSSAAVAIDRIIDVFPEHQQRQVRMQLSIVLRAVLTQFLLPSTRPSQRVPAFEKMIVTSAIANQIRDDKTFQIASQIVTGRDAGMVPLERTLSELLRRKVITKQTARAVAGDSDALEQMTRRG